MPETNNDMYATYIYSTYDHMDMLIHSLTVSDDSVNVKHIQFQLRATIVSIERAVQYYERFNKK